MKNFKSVLTQGLSFLFLISLTLGFSESPVDTATLSSDNGVVKFKIDGVDWISGPPGHPHLKYEEEAVTDGATMVNIDAFAADGSHFGLAIYEAAGLGPGTYPITNAAMQGVYQDNLEAEEMYLTVGMKENTGSVTITSMTADKVVGTFHFALRGAGDPDDIRQITGGSFEVRFSRY